MIKLIAFITAVLIAILPLTATGQAIDYQSIIAQGTAQSISFGPDFEQNHGRQLKLHFTLDVPVNEGQLRLQSNYNQPDRYGSIRFLSAEGNVLEMVDLFEGTIPTGPIADREEALAAMLQNDIVPNLGNFEDLNIIGARRAKVGPYAAIEVVALYPTEAYGQIALRAMGVFPPSGENILVYISHTVLGAFDLPSVNNLPDTFSGTMLQSLSISATRGPDGRLTTF